MNLIARHVLAGCAAIHTLDLLHRDIKPGNIMSTAAPDGTRTYKLIDFGLIKADEEANDNMVSVFKSSMKSSAGVAGTQHFMSPEQLKKLPLDRRVDIWGVGVTLYQLISGQLPFGRGSDPEAVVTMNILQPVEAKDLRDVIGYGLVSDGMAEVVGKMLRKVIDDRFSTAEDAIEALNTASVQTGTRRYDVFFSYRVFSEGGGNPTPEAQGYGIVPNNMTEGLFQTLSAKKIGHGRPIHAYVFVRTLITCPLLNTRGQSVITHAF